MTGVQRPFHLDRQESVRWPGRGEMSIGLAHPCDARSSGTSPCPSAFLEAAHKLVEFLQGLQRAELVRVEPKELVAHL